MYVSVPRWRGTSAVSRLRSSRQVRGLGLIDLTDDPNRTTLQDPFGLYSQTPPPNTAPIVRPDYAASAAGVPYWGAPIQAPGPQGPGFSDWVNNNAATLGLVGAVAVGMIFVSKAMR